MNNTLQKKRKLREEKEEEEEEEEKRTNQPFIKKNKFNKDLNSDITLFIKKYKIIISSYLKKLSSSGNSDLNLLQDILEGRKENTFVEDSKIIFLDEFQKLLLEIVINNNNNLIEKKEQEQLLLTPGIIVYMSTIDFSTLFNQIDNDKLFVLLSLTTGVNNYFFSNLKDNDNSKIIIKEVNEKKDLLKIKTRWIMLDHITNNINNNNDNSFIKYILKQVVYSIQKKLFDRMLNDIIIILEKKRLNSTQQLIKSFPLNVSFAVSKVNNKNFDVISVFVEQNLITFFNTISQRQQQQYLYPYKDFYDLENNNNDNNNNNNNNDPEKSNLNIYLKHKFRSVTLRNYTLENIIKDFLNNINKEIINDNNDNDNDNFIFEQLINKLNTTKLSILIRFWEIPSSILLRAFNMALIAISNNDKENIFTRERWCFGFLTERILKNFGEEKINIDEALKIIIQFRCLGSFSAIMEKYRKKFTVERIKYIAHYIIINNYSVELLKVMLEIFPWLLNTWIDCNGNTLLSLCVISNYKYINKLLEMKLVKRYINVENMNGLNPLFLAADNNNNSKFLFQSIVETGKADITHISNDYESIFHRLAASNNVTILQYLKKKKKNAIQFLIELRRKKDSATALMIALIRENIEAARILLNFGASATTKFGNSQILRTVDAIYLKKKTLSLDFLAEEQGLKPMKRIISDNLDILIEEESRGVAMTGCDNNKDDNLTWSLFNDDKLVFTSIILSGQREKLSFKDFHNEKCNICLEYFNNNNDSDKGITECGHSFHEYCWKGRNKKLNECPLCRQITSFNLINIFSSSSSSNLEKSLQPSSPPRIFRVIKEEETNKRKHYPNIVRFEFLRKGVWINEIKI